MSAITCFSVHDAPHWFFFSFLFLIFSLFFNTFLERFYLFIYTEGKGRRKRGKKHQCVAASHAPPTGDLASDPGICSDWQWNQQPSGSQVVLNPLSHTHHGTHCFFNGLLLVLPIKSQFYKY